MPNIKRIKVKVIDGLWKGIEGEITEIIENTTETIVYVHLFNCRMQYYTLKQLKIDPEPFNLERAYTQGLI